MKPNNKFKSFYLSVFLLLSTFHLFGQIPGLLGEQHQMIYFPDNGDILGISEKSDLKMSFDAGIKWNLNANIKLGYSPLKHLYFSTGIFQSIFTDNTSYETKSYIKDVGMGTYYFFKTQKKKESNILIKRKKNWDVPSGFLVSGLLGYSRGKTTYERFEGFGVGDFYFDRKYFQLGARYQTYIFGIAGVIKFGKLNFYRTTLVGNAAAEQISLAELLMERNNYSLVESSLRIFIGTKFGQFHFGIVSTEVGPNFNRKFLSDYTSFGVVVDIQDIFKEIKN